MTARSITMGRFSQPRFEMVSRREGSEESADVQLRVVGRHQVSNALAAAAAALALGIPLPDVAAALSAAEPRSDWRMELRTRRDGVLVLNDSYNANPDSMAAALRTAVELAQHQRAEHIGARVVAVLGDMLELGPLAADAHVAIGQLAGDLRVNEVVAIGEYAEQICRGARLEGVPTWTCQRDDVVEHLSLNPGDVVLVKGSRGVGLEAVANALMEDIT